MPYSSSITAYPDIRQALDQALESPKGLRLTFESDKAAITFKGRVNSFRYKDRKENSKVYPDPDHPMHGRSAYDPLMVRTVSETVVDVIKLEAVQFNSEEIS